MHASTIGIGGCLCQEHDGHMRPVSFSSHRLTASERKWPITELERAVVLVAHIGSALGIERLTYRHPPRRERPASFKARGAKPRRATGGTARFGAPYWLCGSLPTAPSNLAK